MKDKTGFDLIPRAKITQIGDSVGIIIPKRNLEYSGLKKRGMLLMFGIKKSRE